MMTVADLLFFLPYRKRGLPAMALTMDHGGRRRGRIRRHLRRIAPSAERLHYRPENGMSPKPPSTSNRDAIILGHSIHGGAARTSSPSTTGWTRPTTNRSSPTSIPTPPHRVFADVRGYGKSRHLHGAYSVEEVATDVFRLADHLGWERFHVVGHSMNGMSAQRMAVDDWTSGARRLKSVVAIAPVSASGYPADESTRRFLWDLIHKRELSEQGFALLTGLRLSAAWGRLRTTRHLEVSSEEALRAYYRMWLETDFSGEVREAKVGTPFMVVGGRQDLPGFQEEHLRKTFGAWYPKVEFAFITDAGHYPMFETPVYVASLIERFLAGQR